MPPPARPGLPDPAPALPPASAKYFPERCVPAPSFLKLSGPTRGPAACCSRPGHRKTQPGAGQRRPPSTPPTCPPSPPPLPLPSAHLDSPSPGLPGPGLRAQRLSPPECPRSSCSSRCSHALPSSQSLTSWSHPTRCNHPSPVRGDGRPRGARGRGAEELQSAERRRRPNATPGRREPGAAGRGVRGGGGGGGAAGGGGTGGRRLPRSAAPGSASAGTERAASARRVQLS